MYLPPVILLSVGLGILFLFENDENILLKLENIDEFLLVFVLVVVIDDEVEDVFNLGNELLLLLLVILGVVVVVGVVIGVVVIGGVVVFLLLLPNQLEKKDGFGSSTFFIIGIGVGGGKLTTGFT
jgi:hypothetical protein